MKIKFSFILIGLIFIIFVLTRIFDSSPYSFISMDEAKYLGLARSFPAHSLFNNQLYLVHPPLFPYLIRLFSLILPDQVAGITVSFLFALVAFVVMAKLFRLLDKDWNWITIALFVLVASPLHISTSRVIYKDSMFFGLFLLSLYLYIKGLTRSKNSCLAGAGLAGAACCLTSDLGVYLFPAFIIAGLIFRKSHLSWGRILFPLLIIFLPYGVWLLIRFDVFRNNLYYPAGVDGTIEYVRDFNIFKLFSPRYFPSTVKMFDFRPDLTHFRLHGNVYPLSPLLRLPPVWSLAVYLPAALAALVSIWRAAVRKGWKHNAAFFFSLLLILFTLPVILQPEPRFLLPILLPISYLFSEASVMVSRGLLRSVRPLGYIAGALVVILIAATVIYLTGHRYLVLGHKKEVESYRAAEYLKSLPGDGIMAQVGYPPEIAYLTGKRVTALPASPENLDYFIEAYAIDYLVYGCHYWAPIGEGKAGSIWGYETIRHIREDPARYPLLKVVEEDYESTRWPDRIFIHRVRKEGEG